MPGAFMVPQLSCLCTCSFMLCANVQQSVACLHAAAHTAANALIVTPLLSAPAGEFKSDLVMTLTGPNSSAVQPLPRGARCQCFSGVERLTC